VPNIYIFYALYITRVMLPALRKTEDIFVHIQLPLWETLFLRLPFGLRSVHKVFYQKMQHIFDVMLVTDVYTDDILI